jgi:hypothetical protein
MMNELFLNELHRSLEYEPLRQVHVYPSTLKFTFIFRALKHKSSKEVYGLATYLPSGLVKPHIHTSNISYTI